MKVLAVIPARGESKGVVLKNLQPLLGRPIVAHVIEAAKASRRVSTALLSTDSDRIAAVGREHGAEVPFLRPPELCGDDVTLDPVVHHALCEAERVLGQSYDAVACIQPTCPLVTAATIDAVLEHLESEGLDTAIPVVEERHLMWTAMPDGTYYQQERLNRQWLRPTYKEVGAVIASRKRVVTPQSRIGGKIGLVSIDPTEAIDIDDHLGLWQAELILRGRQSARTSATIPLVATIERPLPSSDA
ncbi:MAG: cytidylyltransferase domain-containing protein [Armatimonadota bacterium]